jgi:hypothetical protein
MHSPVEGIQINHLRTEQSYDISQEVAPTKAGGSSTAGKGASATERIKLYIDARDGSSTPGIVQVNKFKDILARTSYFENERIGTNDISLKSITPANIDNETQKPFVLFSLECQYQDRVNH